MAAPSLSFCPLRGGFRVTILDKEWDIFYFK
jgi:hypothetical protein